MNNTDMRLFCEGNSYDSYKILGSFCENQYESTSSGVVFRVWAPNAKKVQIIGDFNNWTGTEHSMEFIKEAGIWTLFVPEAKPFDKYKYYIQTSIGRWVKKADPYARVYEGTDSVIYPEANFLWEDEEWLQSRVPNTHEQPINIYELHCSSWKDKYPNFRDLAKQLIQYLKQLNFNYIELMPITEYPHDASWGYQCTGYFAVTNRYGMPEDFKYFVNELHKEGIGVIMDWVPSHFAKDSYSLSKFDGTHLYENSDREKYINKLWGTYNFDFEKDQVKSFLMSSACYFLSEFHIDGLRVDAVSNLLYFNNSRYGLKDSDGNIGIPEYIAGIDFVKQLNRRIKKTFNGVIMIAEESGSWENVTKPDYLGGLGFDYKWNMGWMNDNLKYMGIIPSDRHYYDKLITHSITYNYNEKYILPLSHDETVNGKKSIFQKMSENKFANAKAFYGYMTAHPGKKLTFMGNEFANDREWDFTSVLDWEIPTKNGHRGVFEYIKELNRIYLSEKAMWELDSELEGFEWVSKGQSVLIFGRKSKDLNNFILAVCNFSDRSFEKYKVGVSRFIDYVEILNSDDLKYEGAGLVNGSVKPKNDGWNGKPFHIEVKLPACSVLLFKPDFA